MMDNDLIVLEGCLERITYENPANRYAVAKFRAVGLNHLITITGYFGGIRPGEDLRIHGRWETHPRFGEQFQVQHHEIAPPTSTDGIRRLLGSGALSGIGPQLAARLVAAFGADTLTIIAEAPERLEEIDGIGETKARRVHAAWLEHASWRRLLRKLARMGVRSSIAAPLFSFYGEDVIDIIRDDPYRVVAEMPEIGFEAVDQMAHQSGNPVDSLRRGCAGIRHLFYRQAADGHTCIDEAALLADCDARYGIEYEVARECLSHLVQTGEAFVENSAEGRFVCPAGLYHAETGIARRLAAMLILPFDPEPLDSDRLSKLVQHSLAIELSENQLVTLERLMAHRVAIISGGPGTGKTTLIRSIYSILEHQSKTVVLAAPTGRAARRLSQVTGRKAHTLHRLLEYQPGHDTFFRDQDRPLKADAVIVDEVSMVDVSLMQALLNAVSVTAMLILVGDAGQLPSVGPGNVLADLIRSDTVPVFYLTEMFRQEKESLIALNAHRVRQGKLPLKAENKEAEVAEYVYIEHDPSRFRVEEPHD